MQLTAALGIVGVQWTACNALVTGFGCNRLQILSNIRSDGPDMHVHMSAALLDMTILYIRHSVKLSDRESLTRAQDLKVLMWNGQRLIWGLQVRKRENTLHRASQQSVRLHYNRCPN